MTATRTVLDLVGISLRTIGVLSVGETYSSNTAAEYTVGFEVFQDLIGSLSVNELTIPFFVWEDITLETDQTEYTVGESGSPDLNTPRPDCIYGAFIRDSNDYDHPMVIVAEPVYRSIITKSDSPERPTRLWYNPTVPNGTIHVHPKPNSSTDTLYISTLKTITEPTTFTDNVVTTLGIPRMYYNPLKWLMAIELCTEFGREPTQIMAARAATGWLDIVGFNAVHRVTPYRSDVSDLGAGSFETDSAGFQGVSIGGGVTFGGEPVTW